MAVEAELQRERDANQRSEARARELLSERKLAYSMFLNHAEEAKSVHNGIVCQLQGLVKDFPHIDWETVPSEIEVKPYLTIRASFADGSGEIVTANTRLHEAWGYRVRAESHAKETTELSAELQLQLAVLELIAPSQVVEVAKSLHSEVGTYLPWESEPPAVLLETASVRRDEVFSYRKTFLREVRSDLGTNVTLGCGEAVP